MTVVRRMFKNFYLGRNFFILAILLCLFFVLGFFNTLMLFIAKVVFLVVVMFAFLDIFLLYSNKGIDMDRQAPAKLSNGDENEITINIKNNYPFTVKVEVLEDLPFQFQKRDFSFSEKVSGSGESVKTYSLRPVQRGEYHFGGINAYVKTILGLIMRRFQFSQDVMIPVYPSIIQMKKYDFFAISNRLVEVGVKRLKRTGASMEFDQIRNYIVGDDYKKINWKATARKRNLMVNQYRDERSQHVYSVIDMGRIMKMPFNSMALLDYAVNAALAMSNIVIRREDRAGVITFSHDIGSFIPPDRKYSHIFNILEVLYNCETDFLETDYEKLYISMARNINQRSLILLFTNFESLMGLERQLKYLAMIAKRHFLVTIFFENTNLNEFLKEPVKSVKDIYSKTITEKFIYEKKQIIKELDRHGIHSILTSPENLTINTINKYIEIKSRGLLQMNTVGIDTSQNVAIDYAVASVGDRVVGALIDYIIIIVLSIGFTSVVLLADLGEYSSYFQYGFLIIWAFYDLVFEMATHGRSPGKFAMGIKVVQIDGSQPSLFNYLIRSVFRIIETNPFTCFIGIIVILLNEKGQRIGDIAAKTTVVKMRQKVSLSQTILVHVEDDYKIVFKEAELLSDSDMQVIKDVIDFRRKNPKGAVKNKIIIAAKEALEKKMGIQSEIPHLKFLQIVIKDYNHIHGKV